MANRVEIGEHVENALGLNITGATVTVRFHGGAQAPVYDAQSGGSLLVQPLSTVNGKIGADSPSGAWVAAADYDLDVVFGSDTLTFFWPASHEPQFVTTLPAGAGTAAPEDGEFAVELYDATNNGAWLRRWRAAVSAWDMIGGPPPSGAVLPGVPRVRQEFYLTGGSPTIQHMRYNGATWDYVGTPPMVPVTGSPLTILETGQASQIRRGRQLALADFNTLAGLPTVPVGLFNLGSTANLGTGGVFTNKGTVTFGVGVEGVANAAAQFSGSTGQALFIADTGAADPFRIRTGTFGAWTKTAKQGTQQAIITKYKSTGQQSYFLGIGTANTAQVVTSTDGTADSNLNGLTNIADDKWHHVVVIVDGANILLMVDGVIEVSGYAPGLLFAATAPLNIGGFAADGATAASSPHFGRVDEAFVTADILTPDQVRLLYAAKMAHGYATTPRLTALNVRRRRRGAAQIAADFPSQPVRLHSLVAGALTDAGSGAVALTATNTPIAVAGPDGAATDAYNFVLGSSQSLSSTDAGLPSGTTTRSYGCWFKTTTQANMAVMGWGTTTTNDARLFINTAGLLLSASGPDVPTGPFVADGLWHHVVTVEDNAALDGIKRKVYLDGHLVIGSTVLTSLTLAGANRFRIGANPDAASAFLTGQVSRAFVHSIALTQEQISVLYQKSSQALGQSVKEPGTHIEAMDATNLYTIFDTLDTNYQVDVAVAS